MSINIDNVPKPVMLHLDDIDALTESLTKAESLLKIILLAGVENFHPPMIHNVLWALDDLVTKAYDICSRS